jgi:hypothetical protein
MTNGAAGLLRKYQSPLGVAEALIKGELDSVEQMYVREIVGTVVLEAARIRVVESGFFQDRKRRKETGSIEDLPPKKA